MHHYGEMWDGADRTYEPQYRIYSREELVWQENASCIEVGPEPFFQEKGGAAPAEVTALCAACPVQTECLNMALNDPHLKGVWGGISERERILVRAEIRNLTREDRGLPVRRSEAS